MQLHLFLGAHPAADVPVEAILGALPHLASLNFSSGLAFLIPSLYVCQTESWPGLP